MPSIIDRIAIYALMSLCFSGMGFWAGWKVEHWREDAKELESTKTALIVLKTNVDKAIENTRELIRLQNDIVKERDDKLASLQVHINEITQFVKKLTPINLTLDVEHQQLLKRISEEANRPVSERDSLSGTNK
jgi:hypothetical protein